MNGYWAWWWSGLALAAVAVGHWLLVGRMFAVSGRFTALVDRVRFGPAPAADMSEMEMIEAMRAMSAAEFGDAAVGEMVLPEATRERPAQGTSAHVVFVACLVVGGALSALLSGSFSPHLGLTSSLLPALFGSTPLAVPLVLLVGGVFVGFGTRLAGGCTSGHGLCGVSRFQPGSIVTTAAFFGTGVAVSLLISRLL